MVKKFGDFNSLNENNKLNEEAFNKIDYYYLEYDVDISIVREKLNLMEDNAYRGFATFAENIKHFSELDCEKIAIINYPPTRFSKRDLRAKINNVIDEDIDEIEFPWNKKYMEWDTEFWREIVLTCSKKGVKLRPMLEMGVQDIEDIKKIIEYLKNIGIYSIMSSTGLIPEITTITKWNDIKNIIPRMFEVKIAGILNLNDINRFVKSGADLSATTIDLMVNYKSEE